MFWISRKNFIALMEEAHRQGKTSSADLSSEVIQDLLLKAKPGKLVFKLCTVAQLERLQAGKKIVHPLLGEGEVISTREGPAVVFNGRIETVNQGNSEIWSYPIAQISNTARH